MIKYPFLDLATVNAPYADRLKKAAAELIDSGRYIGGPEINRFQERMAELCQVPHAVGISNGLDALRLILEAYKITGRLREGDEVIVAANTYVASVLAISQARLTPVLVDPDIHTMNLSGQVLANAITPRTRAIMPVHLYGRIAWDPLMADLVSRYNLLVVEDAAQAIGASTDTPGIDGRSRMAGGIGHAAAFSFYPTKNIGALGDAGAVTTPDPEIAAIVSALANYGSDRRYHNLYQGFNCRLDPLQAAFLNIKLDHVDEENSRRHRRAEVYFDSIRHPAVILPPRDTDGIHSVWHQYEIRITDNLRQTMQQYLTQAGVGTDIHYPTPPHLQPCYSTLPHSPLPIAELLAGQVLSLPISDCTSEADAKEISAIINQFKPF